MCQPGPLSQRLQRHPPSQDRSKRGPTSARAEVERVFGAGKKPWPFERHPPPSSRAGTFNLRLGQFVDIRHPLKLVETLKEMKELGLKPDILTYNSAMELFGKLGMEDEAWALVDDMKAFGIMPDIETYKFLLQVRTTRSFLGGVTKILLLTYRLFVARPTKPLGPCSE
jgi:pentatricopeptide repeat protein